VRPEGRRRARTPSALAAEQVHEHHDGDGADRERRKTEQTDEEELERQHHAAHSTAGLPRVADRRAPARRLDGGVRGQPDPHEHPRRDHEHDERATEARRDALDEPLLAGQAQLDREGQQHGPRHDDGDPRQQAREGEDAHRDRPEQRGDPDRDDAAQRDGHALQTTRVVHSSVATRPDRPERTCVAQLLILSPAADTDALPALGLLGHRVRVIPAEPASLVNAPTSDVVLVDARQDLASAKSLCKILRTTGLGVPLVLVLTEGGLTAVSADWGVDEVILTTAGPAEVDARIRLVIDRLAQQSTDSKIQASGVTIDEASYSAKVHGRPLDLTFKEFELLRFLATHPSRVFTREQLLSEVWGYDYFGGTRTVDVHVRRLRANLGEPDSPIGTAPPA